MKTSNEIDVIEPEEVKSKVITLNLECKNILQDVWNGTENVITLNNLNKTFRTKLNELKKTISIIKDLSNESDDKTIASDLKLFAESQMQLLLHTQANLRKANLSCKLAIDQKQKDGLLGFRESRVEQIRERKKMNTASQAAVEVTENLLNINKLMDETVNESVNALVTIQKSSKTIKSTDKEVIDQRVILRTSHQLLTTLKRRDITDKILITLAVIFFFGTVFYILKRRLYGY